MELSPIQRAAVHEAGHAVVGAALGGTVFLAFIDGNGGGKACVGLPEPLDRLVMDAAGEAAEMLAEQMNAMPAIELPHLPESAMARDEVAHDVAALSHFEPGLSQSSGDVAHAGDNIADLVTAGVTKQTPEFWWRHARTVAENLLRQNQRLFETVAAWLIDRRTLSEHEFKALAVLAA